MKPKYSRFLEGTKGFCQSGSNARGLPVWQIVLDELDWLSEHLNYHPRCNGYSACTQEPERYVLVQQ